MVSNVPLAHTNSNPKKFSQNIHMNEDMPIEANLEELQMMEMHGQYHCIVVQAYRDHDTVQGPFFPSSELSIGSPGQASKSSHLLRPM
jgi:hypothetical protein